MEASKFEEFSLKKRVNFPGLGTEKEARVNLEIAKKVNVQLEGLMSGPDYFHEFERSKKKQIFACLEEKDRCITTARIDEIYELMEFSVI